MTGIQTVKAQNIELRSRWQWQERYAALCGRRFSNGNDLNFGAVPLVASLTNYRVY
ncbi:MAG UNVERIFIED_CONTAM: hypothetical protein LVR29_05650 [Microcystis novacekii LVE1205-3]|jgi:ABC-type bacteriocin/lantibiotic exporter with double-glycine peptidase domain